MVADTRFFIYDAEIDNFLFFELGPRNVPVNAIWDIQDKRFFGIETEKNKGVEMEMSESKPEETEG